MEDAQTRTMRALAIPQEVAPPAAAMVAVAPLINTYQII